MTMRANGLYKKQAKLTRTDGKLDSLVKIFINKSSNGSSIMKKTYDDDFKKKQLRQVQRVAQL